MTIEISPLAREVEQRLRDDAELFIAVAEDDGRLVLTALLSTESERVIALDVVHGVAPDIEVDDNDIDATQEVAARVPGVTDVGEQLEVDSL